MLAPFPLSTSFSFTPLIFSAWKGGIAMCKAPGAERKEAQVSPNAKWILLLRIGFISGRKGRDLVLSPFSVSWTLILKGQHPVIGRQCASAFYSVWVLIYKAGRGALWQESAKIQRIGEEGEGGGKREKRGEEEQDAECLLHPEPWLLQPQAGCQGWPWGQQWIPSLAVPGDSLRGEGQVSRLLTGGLCSQ